MPGSTTPPHVLHIVPALFGAQGITGGAERYAFELARHMSERVPTRLIAFGDRDTTETAGQLQIRVIGPAWYVRGQRSNPIAWPIVGEVLHADVIHCHQRHVLMSTAAAAVARLTGRRVFATELGGGGWDISAYMPTDRWFHGHLHISEYSRAVYGHGAKPWARVILGGVDTNRFCPDSAVRRSNVPLFVGRLLPHKGIADLIAALPNELPLDIVGPRNGNGADHLMQQSAGKQVRFRYDLDDAALVDAYRRALCLVLPSVYRPAGGAETKVPELLGQTLLEAMACATPVICTRVASMPEIVEDGRSGFIVEPGDHAQLRDRLRWLASHPEEAAAMGAEGRRTVLSRFQWSQVVERCLDAYGCSSNGVH
jgi:glycosyltransferase involved in cell wall biosynthesis